jgi:chromosomal replication initiation ATPase DnaA
LDTSRQLPLDLQQRPRLSREDFIKGRANETALKLIDSWPNWNAPVAIIWGPEGAGKSHLANIWLQHAGASQLLVTSSLGPVSAPLLVEGADKGAIDETALFHLLNQAKQAGTTVLLTARKPPAGWGVNLADLNSRLAAATTVEIEAPDDALLSAVLAKQFADRQLAVEANVISYLVSRMERSLAAAGSVVEELDRLSLEKQVRISRALAALVVRDTDPSQTELDI